MTPWLPAQASHRAAGPIAAACARTAGWVVQAHERRFMSNLSKLLLFKITGTIVLWCIPLILFPASALEMAGFPHQQNYMFARMLGWAYLALCVGYYFGLRASLAGRRCMGPIWVGIVSNGGACAYLLYYALIGAWSEWGFWVQLTGWVSTVATALITIGLFRYGVKGHEPVVAS